MGLDREKAAERNTAHLVTASSGMNRDEAEEVGAHVAVNLAQTGPCVLDHPPEALATFFTALLRAFRHMLQKV
jgi:hypothetical protein